MENFHINCNQTFTISSYPSLLKSPKDIDIPTHSYGVLITSSGYNTTPQVSSKQSPLKSPIATEKLKFGPKLDYRKDLENYEQLQDLSNLLVC